MDGPRGSDVIAMSRPLRCFNILLVGLALAAKKKSNNNKPEKLKPQEGKPETFVLKGAGAQAREDGMKAAAEGRFVDAVPLLERAAKKHPKSTTEEQLVYARVENSLGGALKELDRHDEAVAAFGRALTLLEKMGKHGARDLLTVVNNLGGVHANAGRTSMAEELYTRALSLAEGDGTGWYAERVKVDHDDDDDDEDDDVKAARKADAQTLAVTLNNLGDLRHGAKKYDEARKHYERALSIRERVLGKDHPDVASSLNNVAVLLMDQRKHDEALPLLERAAGIAKSTAGDSHPRHATALSNLGGALLALGRPKEARKHYKRAWSISKTALGKTHESTKAAKEMVEKCDEAETIESQAQSFGVMADDPVIYGRSPSLPPDAPPPEPAPSGAKKRKRKKMVSKEEI